MRVTMALNMRENECSWEKRAELESGKVAGVGEKERQRERMEPVCRRTRGGGCVKAQWYERCCQKVVSC